MSCTLIYAALAGLTINVVPPSAEAASRPDKALTRAAKALGASEISALEFSATGSWYQFVAGANAWNAPANANATPNAQPAAVEERRAEIWSTPQGFVKAALANDARVERKSGVSRVQFVAGGKYRFEGELNAASIVPTISSSIAPAVSTSLIRVRAPGSASPVWPRRVRNPFLRSTTCRPTAR